MLKAIFIICQDRTSLDEPRRRVRTVFLAQRFNLYGVFVDAGTGSNTPRGNPGDIGRDNPRRRRRWFSRKHYASVMNLREFFAANLGREGALVISNALSKKSVL